MGEIYEVCSWDGLRCYHTHPKFQADWYKLSKVVSRDTHTYGQTEKHIQIARWSHKPNYIFLNKESELKTRKGKSLHISCNIFNSWIKTGVQWQSLVNNIIKLRDPWMMENFFTNGVNTNILKTLLHRVSYGCLFLRVFNDNVFTLCGVER
jgi:hypothetical protein